MQGVVVSDKNDKTIVVNVERRVMHPIYKKFIRRSKRFHAHDPENRFKEGDIVRIRECRPLSALKRWEALYDKGEDAAGADAKAEGAS
jgi:small subunit ribosomal protein S17